MIPRNSDRRAFTLTEIMIALAMTALLLVGISRIFAITTTTISSGQALAKAMRSQKAIQTSLSGDFNGVGDLGSPSSQSGMLPLVNTRDKDYASPVLSISNFRVAAYKNQADLASDGVQPVDSTTINAAIFGQRSLAIRSQDLNKNGLETDAGEVTPLYAYGDRNFRTDTLGIFSRGKFPSQTGSTGFIDPVVANEAWIWYGHLRTFNSKPALINGAGGYGSPGDMLTTGASATANSNNRFADDFRLGRFVMLLVQPTDLRYQEQNRANSTLQDYASVVADNDVTKPIYFVKRTWWSPTQTATGSMAPLNTQSAVAIYVPSAQKNETVRYDDKTASTGSTSLATETIEAALGRTDVGGVGIKELHARATYVSSGLFPTWWSLLAVNWPDRFYINPFPAQPFSTRGLSQRASLLAEACSQFIVEYAGDFTRQDPATGAFINAQPDGVLDFVTVNGVRETRWYGLPRDVDGDGSILITRAGMDASRDVIPLADFAAVRTGVAAAPSAYAFEHALPPVPTSSSNYLLDVAEPSAATNGNGTRYTCVWSPNDVTENEYTYAGVTAKYRTAPQLIRILADIRDPQGKLGQAVTQEYVFPIRVTGETSADPIR